MDSSRRLFAVAMAAALVLSAASVGAIAAADTTVDFNLDAVGNDDVPTEEPPLDPDVMVLSGSVDPDTVEENTTVEHTLTFEVTDLSNDSAEDTISVSLPAGEFAAVSSISVVDAGGATVSLSSGPTLSGPAVAVFGVDPDTSVDTSTLTVTAVVSVEFPEVDEDTVVPIEGEAVDSDGDTDTETVATVTVEDVPVVEPPVDPDVMVLAGSVDPDTVEENSEVTHTLTFAVTNLTNDSAEDQIRIVLSDGASFDSPSGATVIDGTITFTDANGDEIPQSSPPTLSSADGGTDNAAAFFVNPDASFDTSTITVSASADVEYDEVGADLVVDIDGEAVDSDGDTDRETVATVTVEDVPVVEPPVDPDVMVLAGTIDPDTVDEETEVDHVLTFTVTNLSNDSTQDSIRLFVDGASAAFVAGSGTTVIDGTITFTDADGVVIPQSAFPTLSSAEGGTDNVGTFFINPDSSFDTSTITVTATAKVAYGDVDADETVTVDAEAVDSDGDTDRETVAQVTVEDVPVVEPPNEPVMVGVGSIDPEPVEEGTVADQTLGFVIADLSNDSVEDTVVVTLSDGNFQGAVTASFVSVASITVVDDDGNPIPVTTPATISSADGGTDNVVTFGVTPDASAATTQVIVTMEITVSYPEAFSNTAVRVDVGVTDSDGDTDVGLVEVISVDDVPVASLEPETELLPDELQSFDSFGRAVDVDGTTAVVGAPGDDDTQSGGGAVYVYDLQPDGNWTETQKLTVGSSTPTERLGESVSLDGDTLVAGAPPGSSATEDAAYVFTRTGGTWTLQQRLVPDDDTGFTDFGDSVVVLGDTVVVGAPEDSEAATRAGAAYVFTRSGSTWTQQAKLTATDAGQDDNFGESVAIDGDTVVVGASEDSGAASEAGAAYVFTRSGTAWSQQAKLTASDAEADDEFGVSVAVDGDTVVVGADNEDTPEPDAGAAYVFTRSGTTWTEQQKLLPTDTTVLSAFDGFGTAVAIDGETIVVGTPGAGAVVGAVYEFTRSGTTWSQTNKLFPDPAGDTGRLGDGVAIDGSRVVAGAWTSSSAGTFTGSAFVFELSA